MPKLSDEELSVTILDRYVSGLEPAAICKELGCDLLTVRSAIREAARQVRESLHDLLQERFMAQDCGLRKVIARAMAVLEKGFCPKAASAVIAAYERQSRLLGLDRAKLDDTHSSIAWMQKLTEQELRDRAKALGIKLPEPIAPVA